MNEKYISTTKHYLTKNRWLGTELGSKKRRDVFLLEDRMVSKAFKQKRNTRIKVSSKYIKHNMRREIINY